MTCHDTYPETVSTELDGRIVVGIDDSPESLVALRWASQQARRLGVALDAVHAFSGTSRSPFIPRRVPPPAPVPAGHARASAETLLRERVSAAGVASDAVHLRAVDDHRAARALLSATSGANMLVLGAKRWPAIGVVLGSTAAACLRHASCPVVLVPSDRDAFGEGST